MGALEVSNPGAKWLRVKHSEIASINPKKPDLDDDAVVSFVPMAAVAEETGCVQIEEQRSFSQVKKGYTPFQDGDILFAKITPCMENGKVALVEGMRHGIGFGSTEFHVSRLHPELHGKFYLYFFLSRAFRSDAQRNMTGSAGQLRVPKQYFADVELPLPPTNEQRRIVAKIEELFSELDQGVESLKTARAQLQTYRQSLLKAAFEGRLTEQWRRENAERLGTADQLLERIREEREARYQRQLEDWQAAVAAWEAAGKPGRKPRKPQALDVKIDLASMNASDKGALPSGWSWMELGWLLARKPQNGRSVKTRQGGFPVLKLTALHGEVLDFTESKEGDWDLDEARPYLIGEGNFLVARGNGSKSLVGRGCRAVEAERKMAFPDTMIRVSPNEKLLRTKCLSLVWQAPILREQIESSARTTAGIYKINQKHISGFLIPVPHSREEQQEIEKMLESKLSEVDAMEATIEYSLQQTEALRQSILKRAFEGRLVPQDPDDEPAAVLLERIRAERETDSKPAGRRGRKAEATA